MNYYRFDTHCHIFTLKYAIKEVKSLLHDILFCKYPWHKPEAQEKLLTSSPKEKLSRLKRLLRELYEMLRAAEGTEKGNLKFLQEEAAREFSQDKLCIVPLMMDIFYMFAYPLDKDQEVKTLHSLQSIPVDETSFQNDWNDILNDFSKYVGSQKNQNEMLKAGLKSNEIHQQDTKITQTLRFIEDERSVKDMIEPQEGILKSAQLQDFYHTGGFCYHMDQLMDLMKNHKGELYPFIAIDPRRPGIINAVFKEDSPFFNEDRRFYGVKLYPRMGFHPQCKPMEKVYEYCNKNNIPIIFHCGKGGFPPSTDWKYADFGNPIHFEQILKDYPNLKIDFAHLGSSDETHEWAKTIVRLINENDNAYSDLSCYTNPKDLSYVKEELWDKNPKIKDRLMFGTDFDVMYFTGEETMQGYYNSFKDVFKDDLKLLMHDNPLKFMELND